MVCGRAPAVAVVDDDDEASGFEMWNDLQTLALEMAWNKVSINPASNRTSQKKDLFGSWWALRTKLVTKN